MSGLSKTETSRLAVCEGIISRGVTVFIEVGKALTEIRDGKLYRASHKTFEAYCKERWEIGRSRAYDLIDQAKVTASLEQAGVDLSDASDISVRHARGLKDDSAALEAVKERVEAGEQPNDAIGAVVEAKRAAKAEQQAEYDRQRDEARENLNVEVKASEARKAERSFNREPSKGDDAERIASLLYENEELQNINEDQKAEIDQLRETLTKYDDMVVEYERGGFEEVIEGLRERIGNLQRQVERESEEKVRNLRSAEYWKKKAIESGANADIVIDLKTGEVTRG
ncbi:MAG TPA: hypothetical protein VNS12_10715 [Pelagibacterium sp.]|uniref:hypothetical protein n=1 Tax=Pelagibacterium sp. TaxID=1967288 RepID=UPI002CAB20F9|nr:hypothetical protein [Pelagibacterium sp.]HWJ88533.1 hypothetical protein [Pelagibacterium sp.]